MPSSNTASDPPLYCWAVSAKRYALFNVDGRGRPILRKASAHGLGHLRAPYGATCSTPAISKPCVNISKLNVDLWQHDLWLSIVTAALLGKADQVDLSYHPALEGPAASQYNASSPRLLRWFEPFNAANIASESVKPFGFLLSFFANPLPNLTDVLSGGPRLRKDGRRELPRPVAPYDRDTGKAAQTAFDRQSGVAVPVETLLSYRSVLAQYHLHTESKFHNGDYSDRGTTRRRHVKAIAVQSIGKEADRLDEQFHLGIDEKAAIGYGIAPDTDDILATLRDLARTLPQRKLVLAMGVSRTTLRRGLDGQQTSERTATKIRRAIGRPMPDGQAG